MAVDSNAVRANANKDGIPLTEIAIVYERLSDEEVRVLRERLIEKDLGRPGTLLGRFTNSGEALFQDKAVSVLYLGA